MFSVHFQLTLGRTEPSIRSTYQRRAQLVQRENQVSDDFAKEFATEQKRERSQQSIKNEKFVQQERLKKKLGPALWADAADKCFAAGPWPAQRISILKPMPIVFGTPAPIRAISGIRGFRARPAPLKARRESGRVICSSGRG
jgi:hypothetical protein